MNLICHMPRHVIKMINWHILETGFTFQHLQMAIVCILPEILLGYSPRG